MSLIKSVIKTAVAAKVIQVATRELSKPENRRRVMNGLDKLAKTTRNR